MDKDPPPRRAVTVATTDRPADVRARLLAAGFAPEEVETCLAALAGATAGEHAVGVSYGIGPDRLTKVAMGTCEACGLRPAFKTDSKSRPICEACARPRRFAARGPSAPCGRNEPCPCGSGKKYKVCCARARARAGSAR